MERMEELYASIGAQGRPALLAGGVPDELLAHPERDNRMSVALVLRPAQPVREQIGQALTRLRAAHPELYYYPADDLHITVLDLLAGRPGLVCPPELAEGYAQAIRQAAAGLPPIRARFAGFTASGSALLVKGYPGPELEALRQRVRAALRAQGLPLEERYETRSCHITAVRFPCPIADPAALVRRLDEMAALSFGECTISKLELTYHNWYDSNKTCLAVIPLAGAE